MKFSTLNVDFSNPSPDPLGSRKLCTQVSKRGFPLKSDYLSTDGLSTMKMVADRHRHAA